MNSLAVPGEPENLGDDLGESIDRLAARMQGNPFTAIVRGGFVRHLPDGRLAFLMRDRVVVGPTEDMARQMIIDTIYSWRYWRESDDY